jgi:Flp pilus assembly protein TadG
VKDRSGQSLVEFALMVPVLVLLIVNAVNFGAFIFAWVTVADAARAGTELLSAGGAANGAVSSATTSQITSLVTSDMSSLLSRSSLVVRICSNNNGTVSCTGAGSSTPPLDPEPSTYVSATVDVSYTYSPPIPLFDFNQLGIHATIPPTVIHDRGVMRRLQ